MAAYGAGQAFFWRKKPFFLKSSFPFISASFCPKHFGDGAFESPWWGFSKNHIGFSINHCKPPKNRYKPPYEQNYRKNSLKQGCTYMLVYSHSMLVYACTFQNRKIWVLGFLTHYFRCILDKNSLKTANLKFFQIFIFWKKFKFCFKITQI